MSRALYVLWSDEIREHVARLVQAAPKETRVTFQGPKRTLDQNSKMWAMLTDIAEQKEHFGRRYAPDRWKAIFMTALGQETEFIPSLDGKTFIPLGHSSSNLDIREMGEMIELMECWGAENGVVFKEPKKRQRSGPKPERSRDRPDKQVSND